MAEALAQLRMVELAERRMTWALEAEFKWVTEEAAQLYPNWEKVLPEHKKRLQLLLSRQSAQAANLSASRAKDAFRKSMPWRMEFKLSTEEQLNRRVTRWAQVNAAKKVTGIADTTRTRISNAIAEGVSSNAHPDEIARTIRDTAGINHARARTISRTESHAAHMTGQHMSMEETSKELDMPMLKVWVATADQNTRDTHLKADGQKVKMDAKFKVGNAELSYPGDPSGPPEEVINCRCAITYETDDSVVEKPKPDQPKPTPQADEEPAPVAKPPKPDIHQIIDSGIQDGLWVKSDKAYAEALVGVTGNKNMSSYNLLNANQKVQYKEEIAKGRAVLLKTLSDMKKQGDDLASLKVVQFIHYTADMRVADMGGGALRLNVHSKLWSKGGEARAKQLEDRKWWSVGSLSGVIRHEMGHAKHKILSDSAKVLSESQKVMIKYKVSEYASTNANEFVAEVYSAMSVGKKYDAEVMNLYKKYGGPDLPKPKR